VKIKLTVKEDQTLWLNSLSNKPKPLFIEIWKNASRFTEFLCQSIDMKDPPTFAVIRDPYTRFWSACKEIFSNPAKDGTPRGETDPVILIENGIKEIRKIDPNFHFAPQTWFKSLYKYDIDHFFTFENLNNELIDISKKFNIKWKDGFDIDSIFKMNINPSDHTNDECAIEYMKGREELLCYYVDDFELYNEVINNNL
jgi:hypothetical protein